MTENSKQKYTKVPFIVKTGNWKARVLLKIPVDEVIEEYSYIEATTQAIEYSFGQLEDREVDMLYLFDEEGKNFFSNEYEGDSSNVPEPCFGVFIACYIEDDEKDDSKWWFFVMSEIFANASQPENVEIARDFEKKFKNHIKKLKDGQKKKDSDSKIGFKKTKKTKKTKK